MATATLDLIPEVGKFLDSELQQPFVGGKAAAGFAPENSGQYFVSVDSVEDQQGSFCLVYSYK